MVTIQAAKKKKQTNSRGKLKTGVNVILAVDVGIQDPLINNKTGNVKHIKFVQGSNGKVYVTFFDEQASLKKM